MSIELQQVTKTFGAQIAVNQLTFSAKKGEILGFLGPNGAGKSTTMKMITGYLYPDSGQIWVCGNSVSKEPKITKSKMGYLPENNPLYMEMYVREYLEFVAKIYGMSSSQIRQSIHRMLEITGLYPERNKKAGQLSKGYKQRLGLAAALIHDPEVLILDEPTSGLDPNQIVDIRNLIKQLGKEKTVIFSSHIMHEVEQVCDRVIIINAGNVVADKPISELATQSLNQPFVIKIVSGSDIDLSVITQLQPDVQIRQEGGNHTYRLISPRDIRTELFQVFAKHQWPLLEMHLEKSNLEDTFRNLTQNPG